MLEFPRHRLALLHELGTRLLGSRKAKTPSDSFARELLAGFHDICMRTGLDRVLVEVGGDPADPSVLYDHPLRRPALAAQLDTLDLDGGGPRNARPGQLADAIVSALGLALVDDAHRALTLAGDVRAAVGAAVAAVVNEGLAAARLREMVIAEARPRCEERHLAAFDKLAALLDERGIRVTKQPKIPLDASQAVQKILADTRDAVIGRVAGEAIDRAKQIIGAANADAAARIDQPVTLKLTPRTVAILRACDTRLPKLPQVIAESLVETLTELADLRWSAPAQQARVYSPKESFAVGELIDHPKFGRGSVITVALQRIEVEFPDGRHTLAHVRASK